MPSPKINISKSDLSPITDYHTLNSLLNNIIVLTPAFPIVKGSTIYEKIYDQRLIGYLEQMATLWVFGLHLVKDITSRDIVIDDILYRIIEPRMYKLGDPLYPKTQDGFMESDIYIVENNEKSNEIKKLIIRIFEKDFYD